MTLIDFDGTIVDLWPRYHAVFSTLTKTQLDIQTYRYAKQLHRRDEDLACYLGIKLPEDYFSRKTVLLEATEYLGLDRLLLPAEKLLLFMEQQDARILTARRNYAGFLWELDHLGLSILRDRAVCVSGPKELWLQRNAMGNGTVIGDDVKDLKAAATAKLEAIMVCTGLCTDLDFYRSGLSYKLVHSLEDIIDRG